MTWTSNPWPSRPNQFEALLWEIIVCNVWLKSLHWFASYVVHKVIRSSLTFEPIAVSVLSLSSVLMLAINCYNWLDQAEFFLVNFSLSTSSFVMWSVQGICIDFLWHCISNGLMFVLNFLVKVYVSVPYLSVVYTRVCVSWVFSMLLIVHLLTADKLDPYCPLWSPIYTLSQKKFPPLNSL